ncbi:von Willebrand factor type A domain protein [Ancylostoma ceylanicum]|uniref:von Willebrand factor type A domain protein n=1 Tax=Ancylostoma ceylanicum TaxID=53326 RepID=A0A0D6LCJ0_9BILA|nr:von Willebrand factor type A domain protein [Ancylostoma ceylanicum]
MKELLKTFLMDHFDLSQNKVRVGVVKYGDTAEVPISLGDYDHVDDLLHRISETRRVKGKPRLDLALKEVAGELLISGSENVPKFVLLLKNGASTDDFREAAETLKKDVGAQVFVVEAGDDESYGQDAQLTTDDKVIRIKQWRGTDSETLGPIADMICKIAPTDSTGEVTWPVRKPTVQTSTPSRACSQIDYPADVIIMLDSSENFSPEEFDEMKESVAELVDAGFDLAPDVARIGFVIYSDKVAVPVALGHYEDKIDLIQQISDSTKINDGVAIALYGLNAARQQFQLHGRENATRIVIMITNGKNRGNAAPAAEDLRDTYNVQLFIIAVNADSEGLATLKRIAGTEYPDRIYEVGTAFELDDHTAAISRHLCGYTTPAQGVTPTEPTFHRTTKRDVQAALTPQPWTTPRLMKYPPLCSDGIKRPYQMNILVDVTSRSTQEDFRLVMDHLAQFFQKRFAQDDNMLSFNLMTVNSQKVLDARAGLSVSDIGGALNDVTQDSDDEESAKLGAGIDSLVEMSNDNYIKGSFKIMLIVSADSTSSDAALPSAEYAADDFGNNIIGLSVRKPSTDLLTRMAGTGTRVIHLDWTSPNELFNSWFAYSVCDYVTATTVKTPTTPTKARPTVARRITAPPATIATPTNVEAVPKSPNSFTVTWTCCTNTKSNYTILYTHDPSIPSQHWQQQSATCRDSFGKLIDVSVSENDRQLDGNAYAVQRLPTDHDYTVCVVTAQSNITDIEKESCTQVTLNKNTTVEDHQPVEIAPCNCLCVEGKAILRPSCDLIVDEYRPIATLPPATEDECPCRIQSHAGRCPSGYLFKKGQCYDIDECANGNGGCSHGCVNTPGGHYCACPYGMTRDPLDPNTCVNSANAFDRIAQLLAQYLHANAKQAAGSLTKDVQSPHQIKYKVSVTALHAVRFEKAQSVTRFLRQATIKSGDNKTITFEWAYLARILTDTTVEDHQPVEIAPCNCLCVEGKAILRPSCDLIVDEYRPIATLPPATEDECPCRIQSHAGRCPSGYLFKKGQCYDIDECANGNGGCSHGCVNTPGGHYCACPYGMTRDPLDPNTCVNSANAFDRIAQLLAQYLHANAKQAAGSLTKDVQSPHQIKYKVSVTALHAVPFEKAQSATRFLCQATIKSGDNKTITFEWASVPAVVRRAFKWLF